MSKTKAIICTVLLFIVVFALLFIIILVDGGMYKIGLYRFITSSITGVYIGDKCCEFYKWLRKDM